MRICTSFAPTFFNKDIISLLVVPLTIESSIKTILLSLTTSFKTFSFKLTAIFLSFWSGFINVLPI